jgi:hypothetical protein
MHTQRAHVILPQDLLTEIDGLVGPRGRSAFLVETARAELQRRRLLEFLRSDEPIWRDENHPELANGSEAWVRSLRSEGRGTKAARVKPRRKRPK